MPINKVDEWIGLVGYSHSNSAATADHYRRNFNDFLNYAQIKAEDITAEYEQCTDERLARRKYTQLIKSWIVNLQGTGLTDGSIKVRVGAVQSFFRYNDLPLGKIPTAMNLVTFHNRDIEAKEVLDIMAISSNRDKAFLAFMCQSGLRPHEIINLKLRNLQPDFDAGTIPCKIEVEQEITKGKYKAYFTFIGQEALDILKDYFKERDAMTADSYLFTMQGSDIQLDDNSVSGNFRRHAKHLKAKGIMKYNQKKAGRPAEIRLYNLRKFFRKNAGQAGPDYVNFWMGHTLGVDGHYIPKDAEHHRKIYAEKAMPFLRLEHATPTEMDQTLEKQAQEIKMLKQQLTNANEQKNEADIRLQTVERTIQELKKAIESLQSSEKSK